MTDDLSRIIHGVSGSNMTVKNLETAVTKLSKNKKLLKEVSDVANKRIKSLISHRALKKSMAYKNYQAETKGEHYRVPPLENPGYGRDEIKAALRFLASKTSSWQGYKQVRKNARENFKEQIIENSNMSQEDKDTLESWLDSLSQNAFDRIVDTYAIVLDENFISGSTEQFNFIGNHMIAQANKYKQNIKNNIGKQFKAQVEQIKNDSDPAEEHSVSEIGDEFNIKIKSTALQGKKKGKTVTKSDLDKAFKKLTKE